MPNNKKDMGTPLDDCGMSEEERVTALIRAIQAELERLYAVVALMDKEGRLNKAA
jgi:cell fate (sporulation/competence/biofilm development) regulator YlbF (YheA/YmcA/DUF963 family)